MLSSLQDSSLASVARWCSCHHEKIPHPLEEPVFPEMTAPPRTAPAACDHDIAPLGNLLGVSATSLPSAAAFGLLLWYVCEAPSRNGSPISSKPWDAHSSRPTKPTLSGNSAVPFPRSGTVFRKPREGSRARPMARRSASKRTATFYAVPRRRRRPSEDNLPSPLCPSSRGRWSVKVCSATSRISPVS